MPRRAAELSALAVKRLTTPGLFAVGGVTGLALQVKASGARSWILRFTGQGGIRHEIGLGGYPDISLATARGLARLQRESIARGEDPIAKRKAERTRARLTSSRITFDEAALRWHAVRAQEYKNAKHSAQVLTTLTTYASPLIGKRLVDEIDLGDVLNVLRPIWSTKTETAERLRGRIENVLAWAAAAKHRTGENPARWRGNLDALLPKPGRISAPVHHPAMPFDDIPAFMKILAAIDGAGARALEFLILCGARSGEVRLAKWSEVDVAGRVWNIPKERMKAGREHRVPLSEASLALLDKLPRFQGVEWMFPGPRGGPISDMTISAVTRRIGVRAVPHGFRSAFRDWAAERTSYPNEVAEMALAHAISNKVEAAYRRGDLFDKRRALMDDWAKFAMTDRI